MATPFADPRIGMLYLRRAVPEPLRAAFEGRAVYKVSLRTKDPAEARTAFAKANADFEALLADARRQLAEGTLVAIPGALVRRWWAQPPTRIGPRPCASPRVRDDCRNGGPRIAQARLRPAMRLKQLFSERKAGNEPRPQTAGEYAASVSDCIDFAGDIAVAVIDADMLYDYCDEAANLPASMPRADRALPFRARVEKHAASLPK